MALTRSMLKGKGLESEDVDEIIEAHAETVNALKNQVDALKDRVSELQEESAKVPALEKQIEEMEAAQPKEDWEAKYKELKDEYGSFKKQVATVQADQEKARLYRSLLRETGIDEKRLESVMKVTDLGKISVTDGAIDNPEEVKNAIVSEWGDFIAHKATAGATVDTPPTNAGGKMTRDQILAIKDTSERQQAIADNIEMFQS